MREAYHSFFTELFAGSALLGSGIRMLGEFCPQLTVDSAPRFGLEGTSPGGDQVGACHRLCRCKYVRVRVLTSEAFRNSVADRSKRYRRRSGELLGLIRAAPFSHCLNRIYVFVALERTGGWMCWDVSDPQEPVFQVKILPRGP